METLQQELHEWAQNLIHFHLPRWQELPDLELYMDQVITLVDQYLSPVIKDERHPLLTAAMVNNYVKKKIIPSPIKKKYNRKHLAFLIAITSLKQVLVLEEIRTGILFQAKQIGIRQAYDLFCVTQEQAVQLIGKQIQGDFSTSIASVPLELIAVTAAAKSFSGKLLAEKMVQLEKDYLEKVETK